MEVAYLLKTLETSWSIFSEFKIDRSEYNGLGITSWKYNTIIFIIYNHDVLVLKLNFVFFRTNLWEQLTITGAWLMIQSLKK